MFRIAEAFLSPSASTPASRHMRDWIYMWLFPCGHSHTDTLFLLEQILFYSVTQLLFSPLVLSLCHLPALHRFLSPSLVVFLRLQLRLVSSV